MNPRPYLSVKRTLAVGRGLRFWALWAAATAHLSRWTSLQT